MKSLSELAAVDWSALRHAYGPADDIPDVLRALAADDPETRNKARSDLQASIDHQGVQRGDATLAAVPFLVGLCADGSTPDRGPLLRLLAEIALGDSWWFQHDGFHPDHQTAPDDCSRPKACTTIKAGAIVTRGFPRIGEGHDMSLGSILREIYDAIDGGLPLYLELAADADADVRASAAYLLAWLTRHADRSAPVLEALATDAEPSVRAAAFIALSHATKFNEGRRAAAIARLQAAWEQVTDPLERRAVALALVRVEDGEASAAVRPQLREWIAAAMPPALPDRSFPWRRIDTAPFVFCTTFIGTPPPDRREVIDAGVRGLPGVADEHDAADLAQWLLKVGIPQRDEDFDALAFDVLLNIAGNQACWYYTDVSSLLREFKLPADPDAIRDWVGKRR